MIEKILIGVLGCLSVADIVTTLKILSKGGRELNPVMRFSIQKLGQKLGLVVPKVAVLAAALIAMATLPWDTLIATLITVNAITAAVVVNNIKVLGGLK